MELLQEANDWVEKEWQEGPRSAWHLNYLVYSVAVAVRGKNPTNSSHATREGNQTIRGVVRDRKVTLVAGKLKALGLEDCLPGWIWKKGDPKSSTE